MYTIKEYATNTMIIQKSIFIAELFNVSTEEECLKYIEDVKNKYKDATHHCYAYIINHTKKAKDDKEPSGTAGIPILNVLEKQNLTNILCIVTRYFGGIKLGAGGLVRAYKNATSKALEQSIIIPYVLYESFTITFTYDKQKQIDFLLKDSIITKKVYQEKVTYEIKIEIEKALQLKEKLKIITNS